MSDNVEQISLNSVKLMMAVILTVGGICGTFFGGIEMAKTHADEKVLQLKSQNDKQVEDLKEEINAIKKDLKDMDGKLNEQMADLKVVRTLLEVKFGKVQPIKIPEVR